jgi:peptide-methionine (S)-S-oxide reductase
MSRTFRHLLRPLTAAAVGVFALAGFRSGGATGAVETVYFAGGCYWGVEAVFEHVKGVKSVVSGFATPDTDSVAAGTTKPRYQSYAEAVRIKYDPAQISYEQLLELFFRVAHDPTQVDRQGPDVGPQYRSIVFVSDAAQGEQVQQYIGGLRSAKAYPQPIVTEVLRLEKFRVAPDGQQDYVKANPKSPYVVAHDLPKLEHLQREYAALFEK